MEAEGQQKQLEKRLSRAEMQLKIQAVVGGAVILVLLISSKYYDRSIGRAPFRVIDSRGNVLLNVGGSPDGTQSHLRLFPPGKDHVAVLYAQDSGGGLDLFDAGGKPGVAIGTVGSNRGIGICDREGRPVAWLAAHPSGGGLILTRRDTQRAAELTVTEDGGQLMLFDKKGKPRLAAP